MSTAAAPKKTELDTNVYPSRNDGTWAVYCLLFDEGIVTWMHI
jgi:hypothetical protein